VASTAGATDASIKVYGDCKTPAFKPKQIILACADLGSIVQDLNWTSWTSTKATGTGTWVYNDCTPDCASGHSRSLPGAQITLTTPVRDPSGVLVWSQLESSQLPPGMSGPQSLPTQPS
jgi:hypothetical protein